MRFIVSSLIIGFFAVSAAGVQAGEGKAEDKAAKSAAGDVTLKGTMMCSKCELKQSDKCQNVLKVTKGGKDEMYYLTANEVAEKNHEKVCGGTAKATVKGKVGEEAGKKTLTASSIVYN